jgi:hypothetical protein
VPPKTNAPGAADPAGRDERPEAVPTIAQSGAAEARKRALTCARESAREIPEGLALVEKMEAAASDDEFFTLEAELGALLEPSPILKLKRRPALQEVEAALRAAAATNGSDPLTRETRRRALTAELQERGVRYPQRLVDAAFASEHTATPDSQGRPLEFEDPEPWPEPVRLDEVLDGMAALVHRFVSLPEGGEELISLWTAGTYVAERFDHTAYLAVCSPEKQCGKSTALAVVSMLARRPLSTGNASPSALFRVIAKHAPTLLLDECDRLPEDSDLWMILNAGHAKGSAVLRVVGESLEPRAFDVYGPKVLSYIRPARSPLPSTLEDRTIRVTLQRQRRAEKREGLRTRACKEAAEPLTRKLARWIEDKGDALDGARPSIPGELDDRASDSWESLLAIADLAGGRWPALARELAVRFSAERAEDDQSPGVVLLTDLGDVLESGELRPDDRGLSGEFMVRLLRELPDRPWRTWGRSGDGLTAAGLARLLKPFGIRSEFAGPKHDRARRYSETALREAVSRFGVHASEPPGSTRAPVHRPSDGSVSDSSVRGERVHASEAFRGGVNGGGCVHPEDDPTACPTCGRDSCPGDCGDGDA